MSFMAISQAELIRRRDNEVATARTRGIMGAIALGTTLVGEVAGVYLGYKYSLRYEQGVPIGCVVGGAIDAGIATWALANTAHHSRQAAALTNALTVAQLKQ